jgi:hypothetical protein
MGITSYCFPHPHDLIFWGGLLKKNFLKGINKIFIQAEESKE